MVTCRLGLLLMLIGLLPGAALAVQVQDDDPAHETPVHGQPGEGEFAGLVYDADLEIWVPAEEMSDYVPPPEPVEPEPVEESRKEFPPDDPDPGEEVGDTADPVEAEAPAQFSRRVGLWIDLTAGLCAPRQVNDYVAGAETVLTFDNAARLGGYIGGGIAVQIPVKSWMVLRPSIEGYVGAKTYTDALAVDGSMVLNAFAPGFAVDFVLNPGGKVVRGFLSAGFAFVISGFVGESGDSFQGVGPSAELGGGVIGLWGRRFKVGFHFGIFGRIAPTAVVSTTHTTAHPAVEMIDFSGAMVRFGPAIRF
jgi:hypothetical protein